MSNKLPNTYQFAQLTDGRCHYRIDGLLTDRIILLIHGATVPAWQFDRIVPYLTGAGFCTIRLDLFGHGYSDRPSIAHNYDLFTRQIFELLSVLGLQAKDQQQKIDLFGHSLGSVIAAKLLLAAPDRFGSLIMAAPILDFFANEKSARLLKIPLLGELLVNSYVIPMLIRRRTYRYRNIEDGRFVGMFKDQFKLPGFGRSLLSLMRNGALANQRDSYTSINKLKNPVLFLRGSDDQIVTSTQMLSVEKFTPRAESQELEGLSHAMILTHPEKVSPHIVRFLHYS